MIHGFPVLRYFIFSLLTLSLNSLFSQKLELFNLDYGNYPEIKANFKANDVHNVPYFNLTIEDANILENNKNCEILYLKPPEKNPEPLSVLLVFDVSHSMQGYRLQVAKEAARSFMREISGSTFELAITSFSDASMVNADFSSDTSLLNQAVNGLNTVGGTDYDSAFLQQKTGIFSIMEKAHYKKIVIFMTDGLSYVSADSIVHKATLNTIKVYCTTIELDMPVKLKTISRETGGDYYEKLNHADRAKQIYASLYNEIVSSDFGTVKWKAANLCEHQRNIDFNLKGMKDSASYSMKNQSSKNLNINPQTVFIKNQANNNEIMRSFLIKATDHPVQIETIRIQPLAGIRTEEYSFPFTLQKGESKNLKFYFNTSDTTITNSEIQIETANCLENQSIHVLFQQKGKIKVTNPKINDVFAVGNNIQINWTGIPPDQNTCLYYRNNQEDWKKIGMGNNHTLNWIAPKDTGHYFTIKATSAENNQRGITKKTDCKSGIGTLYDVSEDGSLVVIKSRRGEIQVFHMESGQVLFSYYDPGVSYVFFSPDSKNLILFYKSDYMVKSLFDQKPDFRAMRSSGRIFGSFNTTNGDEYLLPAIVDPFTYPGGITKISSTLTFKDYFFKEENNTIIYAAITQNGNKVIALLKNNNLMHASAGQQKLKKIDELKPGLKRIIVSPNGKYAFIEYALNIRIIDVESSKTALFSHSDRYMRFSPDGNKIMTFDTAGYINIYDLEKEKKVIAFQKSGKCNFSPGGKFLYYTIGWELHVVNLETEMEIYKKPIEGLIHFSPDEREFLNTAYGKCNIIDLENGEVKDRLISDLPGSIIAATYDVNMNVIAHGYSNILKWESLQSYEAGISETFSIIAPMPDVLKEYNIGTCELGNNLEKQINRLIKNSTPFPIKIESIYFGDQENTMRLVSGSGSIVLNPGETYNAEVGFHPNDVKEYTNMLYVQTPDSIYACLVKAKGIYTTMEFSNKTIDFGKRYVGEKTDTTVRVFKNISKNHIKIQSLENTGPDKKQFIVDQFISPSGIAPGEIFSMQLNYHTQQTGLASGSIKLWTETSPSPVFIHLLGEGIESKGFSVFGKTLNGLDSTALSAHAILSQLDKDQIIQETASDEKGNFRFELSEPCDLLLYAEKENFLSGSEWIHSNSLQHKHELEKNIYLWPLTAGNTIRLNGILFEFARADLKPESENDLNRILKIMNQFPELKLEIHGHTDYIGSDENNMLLSKSRAEAVQQFIIKNGISSQRLSIKYFGESKPVATNETNEGRQLNRRVEFMIIE